MIKSAQTAERRILPNTCTGTIGLDEFTGGGLPSRPTLVCGSAGCEKEQSIAAPTLIKKLPLPLRRFIGDMSQTEKILLGLDLRETRTTPK